MYFPSEKAEKRAWIKECGAEETQKERNILKILFYITMGILLGVLAVLAAKWIPLAKKAMEVTGKEEDKKIAIMMVGMPAFFVVMALVFGFLSLKKYSIGYAITYLVLGELAFLFCVGQFRGPGLHMIPLLIIMAIPFGYMIRMQCQIQKKFKDYE